VKWAALFFLVPGNNNQVPIIHTNTYFLHFRWLINSTSVNNKGSIEINGVREGLGSKQGRNPQNSKLAVFNIGRGDNMSNG
jgi:hypothetical protein